MNHLDHTNADTFEALLRKLPFWDDAPKRATWLGVALLSHRAWLDEQSLLDAAPADAARAMVLACSHDLPEDDEGYTPLCRLLRAVEKQRLADPQRLAPLLTRFACSAPPDPRPDWHGTPYPGLFAFQCRDRPIFFGREAETGKLLGLMAQHPDERLLLVIGPSGCGKSSLVRAGVWGALADADQDLLDGRFPGSARWPIGAMKPTDPDPFTAFVATLKDATGNGQLHAANEANALRDAPDDAGRVADLFARLLARLPAGAQCLLILDQMEELFTPACADSRDGFLTLMGTALDAEPRLRVLATVRSDFYPALEAQPRLQPLLNRPGASYNLPRPGLEALARMIRRPLTELRLLDRRGQPRPMAIETALVERLLADTLGAAGNLALLAFALQARWDAAEQDASGCMTLAGYEQAGGLEGILQRVADEALEQFWRARPTDPERRADLYCQVFSRLVAIREDDGTPTRKPARLGDWAADSDARALIQTLSGEGARLLVCGADRGLETGAADDLDAPVEVAHEALFRAWPLLADWVQEYREALVRRDGIRREAERWAKTPRDALLPRPELIDDLHRQLSAKGLWAELIAEPRPARFLARDDADELGRLTEQTFAEARAAAGAIEPAPGAALDLIRILTNEGRRWPTLQTLGERISAADPAVTPWLRAGLDLALARLAEPGELDWYRRRPALGDLLAVLGDDRPGVGLRPDGLPDIVWQPVPPGEVTQLGRTRQVAGFRMARYPITNAQYDAFQDADDYGQDAWWSGLLDPPGRNDSEYVQPNRPRTLISWLRAMAYCRWLTSHLRAARALGDDEVVRLPTEDEWLLAAAGTDDREYPWGDDWEVGIASCNEAEGDLLGLNLRQTTAVGLYPRGVSPVGLLDCAGNVFEWCLNKVDDPDDTEIDAQSQRGLRGGGWGSGRGGVLVSARGGSFPYDWFLLSGLRVCVAPSP